MSFQVLALWWVVGMVVCSTLLMLWDRFHPSTDKVLSILGLLLWVMASIMLGVLLAAWWMPPT